MKKKDTKKPVKTKRSSKDPELSKLMGTCLYYDIIYRRQSFGLTKFEVGLIKDFYKLCLRERQQ